MADTSRPRYMAAIVDLFARGELNPADSHDVEVRHEDACTFWRGRGPCDCAFDLVIRKLGADGIPVPLENASNGRNGSKGSIYQEVT